MSTGERDPVGVFVSENLTKKMYLNNKRYWNESGQFLHGNHYDDVVALVKRALNTKELVPSPNTGSPKLPQFNESMLAACPDELPGVIDGNPVLRGARAMYDYLERQLRAGA